MNILFANYGDFSTNSIHHIAGFANQLSQTGHDCIVAVPRTDPPPDLCSPPRFQYGSYDEILSGQIRFNNKQPADIAHAWTPRENVRYFMERYLRSNNAKLVVHLEDNEEAILESFYRTSKENLKRDGLPNGFTAWEPMISHPIEYQNLLRRADGVTIIINSLNEFVPEATPRLELWPGIERKESAPATEPSTLKKELGIALDEKVIVYSGGISSNNLNDVLSLYEAVGLLNKSGRKVKLIKTGPSAKAFKNAIPHGVREFAIDLGILPKSSIPMYLSIADVLVQPGKPDSFNNYRLPSKLPEFLTSGIPVITTDSNIVKRMRRKNTVLILKEGTPEEIRNHCNRIFESPKLARQLSKNGQAFAASYFSIKNNTEYLAQFYSSLIENRSPETTQPGNKHSHLWRKAINRLKRFFGQQD